MHLFVFRPAITTAIDQSLKRLGVDSLDLYMVCCTFVDGQTDKGGVDRQIHGPIGWHSSEAMARQLVPAVKSGKVKAVGVSNFSKEEMYIRNLNSGATLGTDSSGFRWPTS